MSMVFNVCDLSRWLGDGVGSEWIRLIELLLAMNSSINERFGGIEVNVAEITIRRMRARRRCLFEVDLMKSHEKFDLIFSLKPIP